MADKPNGSPPTAGDYAALKDKHDKLVASHRALKGTETKLKHELERVRGQLAAAINRGDQLKDQLDDLRAEKAAVPEAAMRAAAVTTDMRADEPRKMYRIGMEPEAFRFTSQADFEARTKGQDGEWFSSPAEAQFAAMERDATPLPELDGQTPAEATT